MKGGRGNSQVKFVGKGGLNVMFPVLGESGGLWGVTGAAQTEFKLFPTALQCLDPLHVEWGKKKKAFNFIYFICFKSLLSGLTWSEQSQWVEMRQKGEGMDSGGGKNKTKKR